MTIGGLQKFSLIDYPGKSSAIVFTRGCMFRCRFCHNPELVIPEQYSEEIPVEEVLDFLASRKGKLEAVTITGGEPTLHNDLPEFMSAIKDMGFLIKLDTTGIRPRMVKDIVSRKLVDYIAMDVKAPFERYQIVTQRKINIAPIRETMSFLLTNPVDYEFRTTVAKILTTWDDVLEITKIIAGAKRYNIQKFVPTKAVDPSILLELTYTDDEYEQLYVLAKDRFEECLLR